ncbi:hypothetical protein DFH06DRAFT_133920 [Mycena polygramma]|nr:hypothetical protein DFH06DRAFT_133920 [Mycena polygramma]
MLHAAFSMFAALLLLPHLVTCASIATPLPVPARSLSNLLPAASFAAASSQLIVPATSAAPLSSSLPLLSVPAPVHGQNRTRLVSNVDNDVLAKTCTDLTLNAVRSLPGMADYADSENFNPESIYLVDGTGCVGDSPFDLTPAPVTCSVVDFQTDGESVEEPGEISFSYEFGFATSVRMKTTEAASLMVGTSVKIGWVVPEVGSGTSKLITEELAIKNKKNSRLTTAVSFSSGDTITLDAPGHSYCYLKYTERECDSPGATARVPFIARGSACARRLGGEQFCFDLDEIDEEGRTSYMSLEGDLSSESTSDHEAICEPLLDH